MSKVIMATDRSKLEANSLDRIIERIPMRLIIKYHDLYEDLLHEVHQTYVESNQKSATDHILRKPSSLNQQVASGFVDSYEDGQEVVEEERFTTGGPPFPQDLSPLVTPPTGWRDRYDANRDQLERSLFIFNRVIVRLLEHWQLVRDRVQFIDINDLRYGPKPPNVADAARVNPKAAVMLSTFRSCLLISMERCRERIYTGLLSKSFRDFFDEYIKPSLKTITAAELAEDVTKHRRGKQPRNILMSTFTRPQEGLFHAGAALIVGYISASVHQSLVEFASMFDYPEGDAERRPYDPSDPDTDIIADWVAAIAYFGPKDQTPPPVAVDSVQKDPAAAEKAPINKTAAANPKKKSVHNPRIMVRVGYSEYKGAVTFEPSLAEVEEAMTDSVKNISRGMESFPRLDSILYGTASDNDVVKLILTDSGVDENILKRFQWSLKQLELRNAVVKKDVDSTIPAFLAKHLDAANQNAKTDVKISVHSTTQVQVVEKVRSFCTNSVKGVEEYLKMYETYFTILFGPESEKRLADVSKKSESGEVTFDDLIKVCL
jgi:hypothetical protein